MGKLKKMIQAYSLANILNNKVYGEDKIIRHLDLCNRPTVLPETLSYITSENYLENVLKKKKISVILIEKSHFEKNHSRLSSITCILSDKPEADFYYCHEYLVQKNLYTDSYNFQTRIGKNVKLDSNVFIDKKGVIIGDNVKINANSVIKSGTSIGDNCHIGFNSIIGCDGFQLIKNHESKNTLVTHIGGIKIQKNVFIGNGVIISKGLFNTNTTIGSYTKIDNFVHISHNCIIGENCVLTAGCILSGSVQMEDNVWLSPGVTLNNKVICENESVIGIGSVVLNNVASGSKIFGNPARKIQ